MTLLMRCVRGPKSVRFAGSIVLAMLGVVGVVVACTPDAPQTGGGAAAPVGEQASDRESSAPLAPSESATPAAGICPVATEAIATVTLGPGVPQPRCLVVSSEQRLRVVNGAEGATVRLGRITRVLAPGASTTFDVPLGDFLAPGVHTVGVSIYGGSGPQLWLRS